MIRIITTQGRVLRHWWLRLDTGKERGVFDLIWSDMIWLIVWDKLCMVLYCILILYCLLLLLLIYFNMFLCGGRMMNAGGSVVFFMLPLILLLLFWESLKNMVLHDFIFIYIIMMIVFGAFVFAGRHSGLAVSRKVIVWVESSGAFNTEHPRRDFFIFFNR